MNQATTMNIGQAFTQALTLMNGGKYEEAKRICLKIRKVRPDVPDVHNVLGGLAFKMGNKKEAADHFKKVVQLQPGHLEARKNLGLMLRDLERWEEAAVHFEYLNENQKNNVSTLMDLGRIQKRLHKYEEAKATFHRALNSHPEPEIVQCELAEILMQQGHLDSAEEIFANMLRERPDYVPGLLNLAILRDMQGRMEESLQLQSNAIRAHPEDADAHTHHALSLLANERFGEGWGEYAWRFRRAQTSTLHNRFSMPFWNGEPLAGKHVLLWTEQGPGDEILISSMLPDLLKECENCTLVCTPRMAPLFKRSFPGLHILHRDDVLAKRVRPPEADFQASLSQLGQAFRQSADAFPPHEGFLLADPKMTANLRERYLAGGSERLVGISWSSANLNPGAARMKSTSLADWSEILKSPGMKFVSLQYGDHHKEIAEARSLTSAKIIADKSVDPLKDMDRFAAQVAAMDLVISVSNTTVHVAGALGIPVWTMVPASLGRIWYWFLERENALWYPSMRLYRQNRGEDWTKTLTTVANDLANWSGMPATT